MSINENQEASSPASNLPWIAYLEEEILLSDLGLFSDLGTALKDLLLSPNPTAAGDAARCINNCYWEKWLPSDPLRRFEDDKGMGAFLNSLWELLFDVSKHIPYNNPTQDLLIQLIFELRKLPPKPFKIWGQDWLVYSREEMFLSVMNDQWNGSYVSITMDGSPRHKGLEPKAYKERCDQWISAYMPVETFQLVSRKIEHLDQSVTPKVMVSAQYILIAGGDIYEEYIVKAAEGSKLKTFGLQKWPIWTRRFEEIAMEYEADGKTDLATVVKKVHEVMVSFPI